MASSPKVSPVKASKNSDDELGSEPASSDADDMANMTAEEIEELNSFMTEAPEDAEARAAASDEARGENAAAKSLGAVFLREAEAHKLFAPLIRKVLKQVHPDMMISGPASFVLSDMLCFIVHRMHIEMVIAAKSDMRVTFQPRDVELAARLVLSGELAKHARSEIFKALSKGDSAKAGGSVKAMDDAPQECGLCFVSRSVAKVFLAQQMVPAPMKDGTATALAATLEYLAAEVLELSGNAARDNKKVKIIPRHITLAVRNDEELNKLYVAGLKHAGRVVRCFVPPCPSC